MTEAIAPKSTQRLVGIDICRSAAIIAAMFSHATVVAMAAEAPSTTAWALTRFVLQVATPIFIGLFGAMLEIAYAPKFRSGNTVRGVQQLLSRSLQCYLLYAACVMVRVAVGDFSPGYALRCLLLIGVTQFTDILKFYAVMLLLAPLFIVWSSRRRYGLAWLVAVAALIQIAHPLLAMIPRPPHLLGGDYLSFPAGFLYGGGNGPAGPSLLHGLSLVFMGMVIGRFGPRLLDADPAVARRAGGIMLAIVAVTGAASALMWDWRHPMATVWALADMSLRNDNHPLYFSLGVLAMTLATWFALVAYDRMGLMFGRSISFIGSTSLFTFSFGNALLILAPRPSLTGGWSLAYAVVLLVAVLALSWAFHRTMLRGVEARRLGQTGPAAWFSRVQNAIVKGISDLVAGPARLYARLL